MHAYDVTLTLRSLRRS